jgi:hypothetical protein
VKDKTDNLLNVADFYDNESDDEFDKIAMRDIFKEIISDYKKIAKKCQRQGVDIGNTEEEQFEKLFKDGSISEKQFVITDMKDRIICLMDLCSYVPVKIRRKYSKDLVDLLDSGFDYLEISEE